MKSVEFSEEQLGDLEKIKEQLFEGEQDPRSIYYKRTLVRPKINWFIVLLYLVFPVAVCFGIYIALNVLCVHVAVTVAAIVLFIAVYSVLTAKRAVICSVKIYQRCAPAAIRNRCRFEPSCSEYAIMAIEKYGLFKGWSKAWGRLRRCNVHGGGFDLP